MTRFPTAIVAASVILSCCANVGAAPHEPTVVQRVDSANLRQGMTINEVIEAVGSRPSSAQQTICGARTGAPWICRILAFGSDGYLATLFENDDGVWRLNRWATPREG